MRTALAVMLLSLLLTGSVYQTYVQEVDVDGKSVITREEDANLFLGLFGENASEKIEQACDADSTCSYSDGRLTLAEDFGPSDGYYEFDTVYGLPYIEYQLEVKKIPTDRFMEKLSSIFATAGLSEATSQNGKAIILSNKDENAQMARFIRESGLDIVYAIRMPGEIVAATAGEVSGEMTYSTANFSMGDVLSESKPIVVKSRELNIPYIVFILAVLVIAAFAASFFFGRKKKR
jgi:hypothetical protein